MKLVPVIEFFAVIWKEEEHSSFYLKKNQTKTPIVAENICEYPRTFEKERIVEWDRWCLHTRCACSLFRKTGKGGLPSALFPVFSAFFSKFVGGGHINTLVRFEELYPTF